MRDWVKRLLRYTAAALLIDGIILVFYLYTDMRTWAWWHNLSEVVQGLGVGVGTLLAGVFARPIIAPIVKRWERREIEKAADKDRYMRRFARHSRDKVKVLIWKLKDSDKIFAIYKPNRTRQHIKTWGTYKQLGYESGDWDKEVDEQELNRYDEGEPIDFS